MRTRAEHTMPAAVSLCTCWNKHYPVGTPVLVVRDNGDVEETETLSPAWMTPSEALLIKVDGIRGGYKLSRVIPIPQKH